MAFYQSIPRLLISRSVAVLWVGAALAGCYPQEKAVQRPSVSSIVDSDAPLTDKELLEAASRPFDKARMMYKHQSLGTMNGTRIVADYPCGDLCPEYTSRHIHYGVKPGPACSAIGGIDDEEWVAAGPAEAQETFCVPKVLAGKQ